MSQSTLDDLSVVFNVLRGLPSSIIKNLLLMNESELNLFLQQLSLQPLCSEELSQLLVMLKTFLGEINDNPGQSSKKYTNNSQKKKSKAPLKTRNEKPMGFTRDIPDAKRSRHLYMLDLQQQQFSDLDHFVDYLHNSRDQKCIRKLLPDLDHSLNIWSVLTLCRLKKGVKPNTPFAISSNGSVCTCETIDNNYCSTNFCAKCQFGTCQVCSCRTLLKLTDEHCKLDTVLVETSLFPIHEGIVFDELDINELFKCNQVFSIPRFVSPLPIKNHARFREVLSLPSLLRAVDQSPWFLMIPLENTCSIDLFDQIDSIDKLGTNCSFVEPATYLLHISICFSPKVILSTLEPCYCKQDCNKCLNGICRSCGCRIVVVGEKEPNNKLWFCIRIFSFIEQKTYDINHYFTRFKDCLKFI
ncbi:hypothetical protein P9112_004265 [Eukaryota sp. TZLM1-RC]